MNNSLDIIVKDDAHADYSVIDLVGEMDSSALEEKRAKLMDLVAKNTKQYLVLNMLNLVFINSQSISYLIQMDTELSKKGQKLVIINAKPNVADVLRVIGLFETVQYYPNLNEFLKNKN